MTVEHDFAGGLVDKNWHDGEINRTYATGLVKVKRDGAGGRVVLSKVFPCCIII